MLIPYNLCNFACMDNRRIKFARIVFVLMLLGTFSSEMVAQRHRNSTRSKTDTLALMKRYADSLAIYQHRSDSVFSDLAQSGTALSQERDGRLYRLFLPLTFYHNPVTELLAIRQKRSDSVDEVESEVDNALMNIYLHRPDLVQNDESHLKKAGSVRKDIEMKVRQNVELADKAAPVADELLPVETELVIRKPNFWTFSGDNALQFLQNYVSDNWYKGGESSYSMVGSLTLNANYNNKQRLKVDNRLELKLGFQNSRGDTLHRFKANNDLIRYTGKVGLQAAKHWYYSLQLLAYTQFTQGLRSNDSKVYSDFMSPFNLNLGLGMDYALSTSNRRLTGNVNLSLLSFNFKYVDRSDLAARNGIAGGRHHTLEEFGSQITSNIVWKISNQVSWKSRFYMYTTYKKVLMEWENTISLAVSRFISANIFLYPRFDDSRKSDDKLHYLQFNEYSSLGFSYSF